MTSSVEPEVHNIIALSSVEDRATATGNMRRKFREVWTRGFRDASEQTNRQTYIETNRHADTLIAVFHTPTGGSEVIGIDSLLVVCSRYQ